MRDEVTVCIEHEAFVLEQVAGRPRVCLRVDVDGELRYIGVQRLLVVD